LVLNGSISIPANHQAFDRNGTGMVHITNYYGEIYTQWWGETNTSAPTTGSWKRGSRIWRSNPSPSAFMGWTTVSSGTFSDASDATCVTDGTSSIVWDVVDTSDFFVGQYVEISSGFPAGIYQIVDISEDDWIEVDGVSDSIEIDVTISTIDPVFEKMADLGEPLFGEMYWNNNANPTVIETANTPIMLRETTTGFVSGWTYHVGSTNNITSYAFFGAGTVRVTSANHLLSTSDIISIRGTTNYNGIFEITRIDANNFFIISAFNGDDGASDWDQGSYLLASANAAGKYTSAFTLSVKDAGVNHEWHFQVFINNSPCPKCVSHIVLANNDLSNISAHSIMDVSAGDRISICVTEDNTNAITVIHGDLSLHKL